MPKPRPSRPPAPAPPSRTLHRFVSENRAAIRWKTAVHREAWRLVSAEGGNRCGCEEFARARLSLMARGHHPPPGVDD